MKIREMKEELRPREKAIRFGFNVLSDHELLMLVVGSGTRNQPVQAIASSILEASSGLSGLYDLRMSSLTAIDGVSQAKALQLLASVEICKRALCRQAYCLEVSRPQDLLSWFEMEYGTRNQEHVIAVFLNARLQVISHQVIFVGTADCAQIHPREIFREAFLQSAISMILVHNHPTGDITPSEADLEITRRISSISRIMGIELLDHLIVAKNKCFSFKESGLL